MNRFLNRFLLMNEEAGAGDDGSTNAGGGEPAANWYDGFSEDVRGNQNITKFESAEQMAIGHINAVSMIGADTMVVPRTDDERSTVYGKLGRPDEASKYEIASPEGYEVNQVMQDSFKELAFAQGLSQNQIQALSDWHSGNEMTGAASASEASAATLLQAQDSLKTEWGQSYDQNATIAVRAAGEFLNEGDKEFINTAKIDGVPIGEHPMFLKMFNNIGKGMMETSKLEGIANEGTQTPQEMKMERETLMAHPAYMDRSHPEHNIIKSKVQKIFATQFAD